jgi:hypothetical protein
VDIHRDLPAEASCCGCEEYFRLTAAESQPSLLTEAAPALMLADQQPDYWMTEQEIDHAKPDIH